MPLSIKIIAGVCLLLMLVGTLILACMGYAWLTLIHGFQIGFLLALYLPHLLDN